MISDSVDFAISKALKKGANYADARVERLSLCSLAVSSNSVRQEVGYPYIRDSILDHGAGIRVLLKGTWGFAYTKDPSKNGLRNCADRAFRLAKFNSRYNKDPVRLAESKPVEDRIPFQGKIDPSQVSVKEKVALIRELIDRVKDKSRRIKDYQVRYSDICMDKLFCSSEGAHIEARPTWISVQGNVHLEKGTFPLAIIRYQKGGCELLNALIDKVPSSEALEQFRQSFIKVPAPQGRFPAVCGGAVLVHEAAARYEDAETTGGRLKLGEQICSDTISIIDDATIPSAAGSYRYDEEGVPGKKKTIIDKGVLKMQLQTRESAGRLGVKPTGNGRAFNYMDFPTAKESNHYMAPGNYSFEELLEGIKFGILPCEEDYWTGTGERFMIGLRNARIIENGKLTNKIVENLAMSGTVEDVLWGIEAVENKSNMVGITCDKTVHGIDQVVVRTEGSNPHVRLKSLLFRREG